MCGICVVLCPVEQSQRHVFNNLELAPLCRRGPDCQRSVSRQSMPNINAWFYGSTLHFRGSLTPQPLEAGGNVLLWNGEIFGGIEVPVGENDSHTLMTCLKACSSEVELLQTFSLIEGPWAFIYWQESEHRLWFGRDVLGRRSLLWNLTSDSNVVVLSSVKIDGINNWSEVPSNGLYCIHMAASTFTADSVKQNVTVYPWLRLSQGITERVLPLSQEQKESNICGSALLTAPKDIPHLLTGPWGLVCNIPAIDRTTPDSGEPENGAEVHLNAPVLDSLENCADACIQLKAAASGLHDTAADQLLTVLSKAICTRVTCQDSHCHRCLTERLHSDHIAAAIDLCSDRGQCRLVGDESSLVGLKLTDLSVVPPACSKLKHCIGVSETSSFIGEDVVMIASHNNGNRSSASGEYTTSVAARQLSDAAIVSPTCGHTRVAILFSGGIDSLVLACLADRHVIPSEPIDLLNVAFQQSAKKTNAKTDGEYDVPDRQTGRQGLEELRSRSPNRCWNFVEINVTVKELQLARSRHISQLIYPLNTVLDDSIGCAVWFAARGQGFLDGKEYVSTARVLLVGMGADEQLGGYSRHRQRFSSNGWSGLVEEIQMEIDRISFRNLGRDDRVISDHGREARCPYLDERVVSFLCSLPMHIKTDLSLPRGVGEKFLLRLVALKLGLIKGAVLPKRAIQFGSRIAKAENCSERASDVCHRL